VFAALAHHLRTAGVTLNGHMAHGTTLHQRILSTAKWNSETVIGTISALEKDQYYAHVR